MRSNHLFSACSEIRRKITLRSARILGLSVLWVGAVTLAECVFLYDYFLQSRIGVITAVIIWVMLYLIGLLKIGFFSWLFDLSWEGTLVGVKYHTYSKTPGLIVNPSTVYEQTEERLKIRLPNGTMIRRTIPHNPKLDAVIYREGDLVRYLRGTSYPMILKREGAPAPRICVFCSDVQPYPDRTRCDFCGITLYQAKTTESDSDPA